MSIGKKMTIERTHWYIVYTKVINGIMCLFQSDEFVRDFLTKTVTSILKSEKNIKTNKVSFFIETFPQIDFDFFPNCKSTFWFLAV